MMIEDRDVTAQEAARLFGIPVGVVYAWARAGDLTACQILKSRGRKGEEAFYRLSEVAGMVAKRHADQQRKQQAAADRRRPVRK